VKGARGNRREVLSKILEAIRKTLPATGIDAEVMGREKHLYGIYRKMRDKHLSFSQVLDIYGFRIIVKDRPTCYLALGALHALYQPVPGKFKDYIAIPKANGYQSLHTTLIGPFGTPVEIQIRNADMHHIAESGVASHWLYKDESTLDQLQKKTHKWLQSLVELQSTTGNSSEFLEHVKVDLFPSEVYVFSPKGKIFALPRGATPVDLAYAVHTDIGDRCIACRINFETMPLRTELRNGDRVEIITAPNATPSPVWLGYVKSARARSRIRHFLNTQQNAESAALGERLLAHALRDLGLALAKLPAKAWDRFKRASGARSERSILADIGLGKRLPAIVARRLAENSEMDTARIAPESSSRQAILIHGAEGVAVRLGTCCRPIPGDPIVGLIRKGQGLMVHTHDCPAIIKLRSERGNWIDVEWEPDITGVFDVSIRVVVHNVRGVLARLAAGMAEAESNIVNISMDDDSGKATTLFFTLQVTNRNHLARILRALRRVPEVVRITRYVDPKH
jgi:guanosine-3',5'-bis(diphosphate) 3'-pyrophosphohydrolase